MNTVSQSELTADFEPSPEASDYDLFTRAGEWYVVVCLGCLMLSGACSDYIQDLIQTRAYWFTRLTPYNLYPSILYFYGVGFVIGLFIIFHGKKPWHVPIKGRGTFLVLWFVYVFWGFYGAVRGNAFWHQDIRNLILPGIVVPWVVVLAQNIRYEVVLSRFVKLAIPFGPFLSIGAMAFIFFGPELIDWYFGLM